MELNAKEFVEAVKGKDASAYGAEYKKPSEEQKSAFAEREKTLRDCVPDEMKDRPNWVAVKTWWNEAKGRVEKRPINCNTGDYAESDNPATWTSFENALKYARENGATTVAYALDGKDKIACIDLDRCYREGEQLAHLGMNGLKEATITGWFKRSMELLRPLYNVLVKEILRSDYCQADETTTNVINPEKHATDREYVWMIRAVTEKLAAFFYEEGSRSGKVIKELTDRHNYKGYLQCDGFAGYTSAYKPGLGVTLVNCLAHIRRYFEQALEENRKPASWFLRKIQGLYMIEHECDRDGMTYEQRRLERESRSKPLMEEMRTWMETEGLRYSQRTLIGKAVSYAYTRWGNMMHILDDGRLLLDNNLAENEIRPITLGRKNYLFCGNHEAAENMCVITSLLATCRNHNVNPRTYLNDIIARMPYMENASEEELIDILPHRWIFSNPEAVVNNIRNMAK